MRHEPQVPTTDTKDLRLPNGCLLCGGDLDLRVTDGAARSFCGHCHWISRPHMQRHEDGIHIVHPAGGIA